MSKSVLKDIRVLSCTHLHAGPWCGKILAELGAEVIKIEPVEGEFPRKMIPLMYHGENYFVMQFSDNKKFITLNLKHEKGRKIFLDLVKVSDVFLESYTPPEPAIMRVPPRMEERHAPEPVFATLPRAIPPAPSPQKDSSFIYAAPIMPYVLTLGVALLTTVFTSNLLLEALAQRSKLTIRKEFSLRLDLNKFRTTLPRRNVTR